MDILINRDKVCTIYKILSLMSVFLGMYMFSLDFSVCSWLVKHAYGFSLLYINPHVINQLIR